jgi:hypothetical protein
MGKMLFFIINRLPGFGPVLIQFFKYPDLFFDAQLGLALLPPAGNAANLRAELAEIAVRAGVFFIAAFFHR